MSAGADCVENRVTRSSCASFIHHVIERYHRESSRHSYQASIVCSLNALIPLLAVCFSCFHDHVPEDTGWRSCPGQREVALSGRFHRVPEVQAK